MKKVLITGENSYIGTSVEKWLLKTPDEFEVTTISVRGEGWKQHDFSKYDAVFHVAGIAHIKETKKNKKKYYSVNYELTKKIAEHSKLSKVKHFVFLSSMSIFGLDTGVISSETEAKPVSGYGESKLLAENFLKGITTEDFVVSIVRPPMVYGKGCKGNYQTLSKFAKVVPLFPKYHNERSMIFIDNLSSFIRLLLMNPVKGVFHPQNLETVSTSILIKEIRKDDPILLFSIFNPLIHLLSNRIRIMKKIFGTLYYDSSTVGYPESEVDEIKLSYQEVNFSESIKKTEE